MTHDPFAKSPGLQPRQPGLALLCCLALVSAAALLSGCGASDAAPAPVAKAPAVGVAPAVQRQVRTVDEFSGRLEATDTVELRPRVSGYIDKLHFRAGQEVAKGQLLFSIDAATYRAEAARVSAQLTAARAAAALARSEQARAQSLWEQKAISRQEFDQLATAQHTSDAAVEAAQAALDSATLNLGYCQIRAPIAGRISRTAVTEGNLVAAGTDVLASIVSLDRVYAYFDASEATYLKYLKQSGGPLDAGRGAGVAIRMGLLDDTGFPHEGKVDAFDNRINAQTGSIRTRAVFDNRSRRLTTGLYTRLQMVSGTPVDAVMTPERAIGTDQSRKFVVVIGDDQKAQFRPVQLGPLLDGMRVVTTGLRAGEKVVVDGLQRVRPGSPVTPELVALDDKGQPVATVAAAR